MCLGIPGKVVDIDDSGPLRMGRVDFGGVRKEACLAYLPEVVLGDYVIVHVGFAISRVNEEEALKTIELLKMLEPEGVQQELDAMAESDRSLAQSGASGLDGSGAAVPAALAPPEPAEAAS